MHATRRKIFWRYAAFWLFLVMFKFGGSLHWSLITPLGEQLMPLWIVGVIMSACSVIQLLLDVPVGRLMDRFGYLLFLKIGTIVLLCTGAALFFGLSLPTYFLSLIASVFGWLFFTPGVSAYVLSQAPKEEAGEFISLRDVFESVGVVLASAVLPLVLLLHVPSIGLVITLPVLLGVGLLFLSPCEKRWNHVKEKKLETQHHYIRRQSFWKSLRSIGKLKPASTMLLLLGFSSCAFYGAIWFVVPLVIAHQANAGLLGIGLGIFDFAIVVLGFLLGSLADRYNRRTLVFIGLLLFAIAGMLIGLDFGWFFILFGFLATSGDEMAEISLWSWLHALDREHANDGVITGVISLFQDLGWAVGPLIAGILYALVGPSWTLTIAAVPILLVWVAFQFVMSRCGPAPICLGLPPKPHRRRHKS